MNKDQNIKQEILFSETESDIDSVGNPEIKNNHQIKERENPYICGSDRSQTVMFPPLVDDYVSNDGLGKRMVLRQTLGEGLGERAREINYMSSLNLMPFGAEEKLFLKL